MESARLHAVPPTGAFPRSRAETDAPAVRRAALANVADLPRIFAAAPHRLMFFAGATSVIVSMLWWASVLGAARFGWRVPTAPVPPGWAHAVLTQYGMLPMFVFGFLLTVFPRWMNQPALPRRRFVPVFAGMFGGYVVSHIGLLGDAHVLIAGLVLMLAGWIAALVALGAVLIRHDGRDPHALSCYAALAFGACGLFAFVAFALGAPWQLAFIAIRLGTFALLVPLYFTVCHRMIPFFSANVVPGYRIVRPRWSLALLWALIAARLGLEFTHRYELLWLADLPLAVFFAWHWLAWQPWKARQPGLLAALHIAFAWLPLAFGLFAAQSLILALDGNFVLGRAPVHALTVGFFGSMLVAMVTRVTQGHSGRPLEMGRIPWLCFGLLQIVALMRIAAESAHDKGLWLAIAAFAWVVAFLPWTLRAAWIYLTPRADGKPG